MVDDIIYWYLSLSWYDGRTVILGFDPSVIQKNDFICIYIYDIITRVLNVRLNLKSVSALGPSVIWIPPVRHVTPESRDSN